MLFYTHAPFSRITRKNAFVAALLAGFFIFCGNAAAQSMADLQQLQQQAQQQRQQSGSSSAANVSPMNVQTNRTLPGAGASGARQNVGQYQTRPRSGISLPGEPTIDMVFPEQEALSNPPFAANLFIGGFESERTDGLNDNYLIAPGDKISIWMWGETLAALELPDC